MAKEAEMKRLIIAALLALASAPVLAVTLPNGDYCSIRGNNHQKIYCANKRATRFWTPYVQRKTDNGQYLSTLLPSPGGKYLYFTGPLAAVEGQVNKLSMQNNKVTALTPGNLVCVVLGGQFRSDLVVQEHKYYISLGSYNPIYLFSPAGKSLGIVSDSSQKFDPRGCATLGEHE
jgi:hypothetical protein